MRAANYRNDPDYRRAWIVSLVLGCVATVMIGRLVFWGFFS